MNLEQAHGLCVDIPPLREFLYKVARYKGEVKRNAKYPNDVPRKLLDVSKAEKLDWQYSTGLEEGIKLSYQGFLNNPMRTER